MDPVSELLDAVGASADDEAVSAGGGVGQRAEVGVGDVRDVDVVGAAGDRMGRSQTSRAGRRREKGRTDPPGRSASVFSPARTA